MNKAHFLDFDALITPKEIEDNLSIDTGIVPVFWGDMLVRDHMDNNGIWTKTDKIMRVKVLDKYLQILHRDFRVANASPNLSQFLQKLEHCTGENAEALDDHLKHSKLKVKGFGIDPNSREVITVVVSSFTGQMGNWAADHADENFKLNSIDAFTAYARPHRFFQCVLEGKKIIFSD
jgi:hypothetical protein